MVDSIVVGLEAVAEHFGKSVRQVQRWQAEGMPRLSKKRYDLLQIGEWLEKRKSVVRPGPRSGYQDPKQLTFMDQTGGDKDFHEQRLKRAKADEAEMKVKQLRSELLEKEKVDDYVVSIHTALKQGLLTFQRALPPQLIHCQTEREMEQIIGAACRELLTAWSRPLPEDLGGFVFPD